LDDLIRFIPGPTWVHPDVLKAQARGVIGHREPLTAEIHSQCEAGLRAVFQTQNRVFIATCSGSGMMEAAVRNLVAHRSLHLVCGAFSKRWYTMAQACGKTPEQIEAAPGEGFSGEELRQHLATNDPYEAIFITHNETSTGVANPVGDLCAVATEYPDMLICVDAVSSMAGVPLPVDELGIDYCVTSSQKCFALPPGLSFASVSPRALEKAATVPARGWYFDFLNLEKYAAKGHYPSTPALTLMYALAHQLARILDEGLEDRWARHAEMAERVRAWGEEHLGLFAAEGYRSDTLTTVRNSREIDFAELAAFLKQKRMTIANGYGDLKNQTFRIAHMGDIGMGKVEQLLAALTEFLNR